MIYNSILNNFRKFNSIFEKIMEKNSNLSSPDPNRHE